MDQGLPGRIVCGVHRVHLCEVDPPCGIDEMAHQCGAEASRLPGIGHGQDALALLALFAGSQWLEPTSFAGPRKRKYWTSNYRLRMGSTSHCRSTVRISLIRMWLTTCGDSIQRSPMSPLSTADAWCVLEGRDMLRAPLTRKLAINLRACRCVGLSRINCEGHR